MQRFKKLNKELIIFFVGLIFLLILSLVFKSFIITLIVLLFIKVLILLIYKNS